MPIRETFWNIPHWAEIAQYCLAFLTIFVFAYGVYRRIKTWRQGQPEKRTDRLAKRLLAVLQHGIAQIRLIQDPFAGIMHLAIFWGMAALSGNYVGNRGLGCNPFIDEFPIPQRWSVCSL